MPAGCEGTIVNQEEADRDIPKLLEVPAAKRFLSMEPLLGPVDLTRLVNAGPLHSATSFVDALRGGTWGAVPSTGERLRVTHGPLASVDWVIVGGESGPGARPMHPDWARSLRNQCAAAGVPFLFKQWGEWRPICQGGDDWYQPLYRSRTKAGVDESQAALDDVWGRDCTVPELCLRNDGHHASITEPGAWQQGFAPVHAFKVGKKAAGRLLDGITHDGFPA